MTETRTDRGRIRCSTESPSVAWNRSGTTRATTARYISAELERAAVALNLGRGSFSPAARSVAPRTKRRFPRMLPVMDAFTTAVCPAFSAAMATMSSAALPNVAFRSPPSPGPGGLAPAWVAEPIHRARGTRASAASTNTHVPACSQAATTVAGTNASRPRKILSAPLRRGRAVVAVTDGGVLLAGPLPWIKLVNGPGDRRWCDGRAFSAEHDRLRGRGRRLPLGPAGAFQLRHRRGGPMGQRTTRRAGDAPLRRSRQSQGLQLA